jgi:hypothetical protein
VGGYVLLAGNKKFLAGPSGDKGKRVKEEGAESAEILFREVLGSFGFPEKGGEMTFFILAGLVP